MDNVIQLATNKFKLDINGTHGLAHWQRVEANGIEIAQHTGANVNVVRHFAYLHDACRDDEYEDDAHGLRAFAWVTDLWRNGKLPRLTKPELAILAYAIMLHNHGNTSDEPTTGTCWDADRLDLTRCKIIPAARFMSTAYAKQRIEEHHAH